MARLQQGPCNGPCSGILSVASTANPETQSWSDYGIGSFDLSTHLSLEEQAPRRKVRAAPAILQRCLWASHDSPVGTRTGPSSALTETPHS